MDGPEWAAGKLSEDHKDNRWSLLSADLRELEQANAARKDEQRENVQVTLEIKKRLDLLEAVCEQCILEYLGNGP